MRKTHKTDSRGQIANFKRVATESGCAGSEAAFDRALGRIGKAKVPPEPKKKRKPVKLALPGA